MDCFPVTDVSQFRHNSWDYYSYSPRFLKANKATTQCAVKIIAKNCVLQHKTNSYTYYREDVSLSTHYKWHVCTPLEVLIQCPIIDFNNVNFSWCVVQCEERLENAMNNA